MQFGLFKCLVLKHIMHRYTMMIERSETNKPDDHISASGRFCN